MKILLTSAGITNNTIARSFLDMVGKPPAEIKLAFIPTAANVEEGNKAEWLFEQYETLKSLGIRWIDMIDFAAADVNWRARLAECDVLFLTGGNTFYLLDQMRKHDVGNYLKEALKTKLYVGTSASSIVMGTSIDVANIPPSDPNFPGLTDLTGLKFVNFEIEPHCDEPRFETIRQYAKSRAQGVYALDDQSAILVVDETITVVSEGKWQHFQ